MLINYAILHSKNHYNTIAVFFLLLSLKNLHNKIERGEEGGQHNNTHLIILLSHFLSAWPKLV